MRCGDEFCTFIFIVLLFIMIIFLTCVCVCFVVCVNIAQVGSFFERYPRHETLISINKQHTGQTNVEFNLRHDWNSLITDSDDERAPPRFAT